jgi:hypothetical protein
MRTALIAPVLFVLPLFACSANVDPTERTSTSTSQALSDDDEAGPFDVQFTDCTEQASLTGVPVANVRKLVPSHYALANESTGTTVLVVRIANCKDVVVAGKDVGGGTVAQIGANLVSPDGTGNINNYTIYYSTTSERLAKFLERDGVPAQHVADIHYDFKSDGKGGGTLDISVGSPMNSPYTVGGPVVSPTMAPVPYTANWWADDDGQSTRMQTPIPAIAFGGATMTLHTNANSKLGKILGGGTVTFPYFDSYNAFYSAPMHVSYVAL